VFTAIVVKVRYPLNEDQKPKAERKRTSLKTLALFARSSMLYRPLNTDRICASTLVMCECTYKVTGMGSPYSAQL
jgi:hypothetical protein